MELWLGNARKATICHYCAEIIKKDSAVLQGRVKKRKGKPWPPVIRWHLDCWYQSAQEFTRFNQPARVTAHKLGRPKLLDPTTGQTLSPDSRAARAVIVRRFNVWAFRRLRLVEKLSESPALDVRGLAKLRHITDKMQECADSVAKLGPIPPKWSALLAVTQPQSQDFGDPEDMDDDHAGTDDHAPRELYG